MRKLLVLFSVLTLSLFYSSCQREVSFHKNENDQISKARNWFNNYLIQPVNPFFKNVKYHWEKASTFTFRNGYKVVTIPITEKFKNPAYYGRRVLYLYPWKNGKGYYATFFEFLPSLEHLSTNKGNIDLKTFSGYISTWDLKKGFIRGAKFNNGIAERNINIEVKTILIRTNTQQERTNTDPITLPNVTVVGYIPGPNWGTYWLTLMNSLGYSTSYLWDGGSGNNPCEYSGCNYSENPYDYFDPNTVNKISQELVDDQWLDEHVKDSTNNPCAADAINQLSSISERLPVLIRDFFSADGNFSMTIKMADLGAGVGGGTTPNVATSDFDVKLNSYFDDATDLALATTVIHEAFHCQLMSWFREAVVNNDQARKEQLAADYGYIFSQEILNMDSSLVAIVNGGNATQHQDIVNRYKDMIAEALFQFAQAKSINADLNYCKDLAWSGTFDSRAFQALSFNEQQRIIERVNAEKDPTGDKGINTTIASPKGHPCP